MYQLACMFPEKYLHQFWLENSKGLSGLKSTNGKSLSVIEPGMYNRDQGPDFLMARILIDGQLWVGNIELHHKTSDWFRHNHQMDRNYNNVILHVVWKNDLESFEASPVLSLEENNQIIGSLPEIGPVQFGFEGDTPSTLHAVASIGLSLDEWGFKRLERRASLFLDDLWMHEGDQEKTCWTWLAKAFGSRVNSMTFQAISTSFPFYLLKLYRHDISSLESLLLGQAGLLQGGGEDHYQKGLFQQYRLFQQKYGIKPVPYPLLLLRMRPVNFPTIRLVQLSACVHNGFLDLDWISSFNQRSDLNGLSAVEVSSYWKRHYLFGKASAFVGKNLGKQMATSILLNVFIPFLYAKGLQTQNPAFKMQAEKILREMMPENNSVVRHWKNKGVSIKNGFQSQAILEFDRFGKHPKES
ncbi:MAG: hypothetical protein RLY85_1557 [Bacteroidota bacterium]|jgi:hypothetical protein